MTDHCNARYSMALYRLVDAMRRADAEFAASHSVHQTTDAEWDMAIEMGEEMLDELSTDDEQRDVFDNSGSERLYKRPA
jgi:hypothetical protein